MRVGGMLRESWSTSFIVIAPPVFLLLLVARANSLPLQYLPEIPGYVPVYIRYGDQPLEDINPDLAGAFHETSGIFNRIREIPLDELPLNEISNKVLSDKNDISLHSKEEITPHKTSKLRSNHFIAIAPREISNLLQKSISLE